MSSQRIAVVTGSSRGIGRAIAEALAKNECIVVLHAKENSAELSKTLENIRSIQPESEAYAADFQISESIHAFTQAIIARFGHIDILVNNAGIISDKTVGKMTENEWQSVLNVNLSGTFKVSQGLIPYMNDGGHIINLSSISGGVTGLFGQTNYSASKAGIIGFTKSLSLELAARRITVNAICPGFIETAMTASIPADRLSKLKEAIPFKRMGTPDEVAAVARFLASKDAAYITGQNIVVDGGFTVQ